MIRLRCKYANQKLELEHPLSIPEGTELEVFLKAGSETEAEEKAFWSEVGLSRLEEMWDNPEDALYDDWKKLYGV